MRGKRAQQKQAVVEYEDSVAWVTHHDAIGATHEALRLMQRGFLTDAREYLERAIRGLDSTTERLRALHGESED